jgi:hypothetical protein
MNLENFKSNKLFRYFPISMMIIIVQIITSEVVIACDKLGSPSRSYNDIHFDVNANSHDICYFIFTNALVSTNAHLGSVVKNDAGLEYERVEDDKKSGFIVKINSVGQFDFAYLVNLNEVPTNKPYQLKYIFHINANNNFSATNTTLPTKKPTSNSGEQSNAPVVKDDLDGGDYRAGYDALQKSDFTTAFKIFKRLADEGNHEAEYAVASMYANGQGVDRNLSKSLEYLKNSAAGNLLKAIVSLADYYDNGSDYSNAFKWYSVAAKKGNLKAMYKMADYLHRGSINQRNEISAFIWADIAANKGFLDAKSLRGQIMDDMTASEFEKAQIQEKKCISSDYKECNS